MTHKKTININKLKYRAKSHDSDSKSIEKLGVSENRWRAFNVSNNPVLSPKAEIPFVFKLDTMLVNAESLDDAFERFDKLLQSRGTFLLNGFSSADIYANLAIFQAIQNPLLLSYLIKLKEEGVQFTGVTYARQSKTLMSTLKLLPIVSNDAAKSYEVKASFDKELALGLKFYCAPFPYLSKIEYHLCDANRKIIEYGEEISVMQVTDFTESEVPNKHKFDEAKDQYLLSITSQLDSDSPNSELEGTTASFGKVPQESDWQKAWNLAKATTVVIITSAFSVGMVWVDF